MISEALTQIADKFAFEGKIMSINPLGDGHINETYLVNTTEQKYVMQKLSSAAFHHPEYVMSNMLLVTDFLKKKSDIISTDARSVIRLVFTKNGDVMLKTPENDCWRAYVYIDHVISLNLPDSPETFMQSGKAFGRFANQLDGFDANSLYETIPHFHDTPVRLQHFADTLKSDMVNRAENVNDEIQFVLSRAQYGDKLTTQLKSGVLPLRVTHNDTKLNNVLLDEKTHEPVCVIDLDTIMPGLLAWDFGDSIRFGANTAAEDEVDVSKIHFSMPMFRAFAEGYISESGNMMTANEVESLPLGAWMMTYELVVRFLDDYLDGDRYFHTAYPEHNLVRTRSQLTLLQDIERNFDNMVKTIHEIYQSNK